MLALSTRCAPEDLALDRAVHAFRDLGVRAVALHRAPRHEELAGLARFARRIGIVALFDPDPDTIPGDPVLVVEGGPAGADRETTLDGLCRRLHAWKGRRVALRTPPGPESHPSPAELAPVHEAVAFVGYWHDASRGGGEWLDAAGALLYGASFDPLEDVDLRGLRDALPAAAPAVVELAPGTPKAVVREALACARGVFRA